MVSRKKQAEFDEIHQNQQKEFERAQVRQVDQGRYTINGQPFELLEEKGSALDLEVMANRYTPIFDPFDYLVGDWSYDQLRLKGFYREDKSHVRKDQKISHLEDYLYEYCAFGCRYFVLEHLRTDEERQERDKRLQQEREKEKHTKSHKGRDRRRRKRQSHGRNDSSQGTRLAKSVKKSQPSFEVRKKQNKVSEGNDSKKNNKHRNSNSKTSFQIR